MYRFPISQSLPHISIDFPQKVACLMAFAPHRDSYIMSDCLIISEPSDTRAGSVFYRYLALFLFLSQMNGTTRSDRDSGYWDTPATDKPTGTHRYIWRTRRYRSAVEPLLAETRSIFFYPSWLFFSFSQWLLSTSAGKDINSRSRSAVSGTCTAFARLPPIDNISSQQSTARIVSPPPSTWFRCRRCTRSYIYA